MPLTNHHSLLTFPFFNQFLRLLAQRFRLEFKRGENFHQAVYTCLRIKETIYHSDAAVFNQTVAALKIALFIANRVVYFAEQFFNFF